jgi:lysyl-tRNA synthetase class 2
MTIFLLKIQKQNLLLKTIRNFFETRHFFEVETPICVPSPGMEINLSPMEVCLKDIQGNIFQAGLITSPEYAMKKILAQGLKQIFTLAKVFRNEEPFDEWHNGEFSLLEWYVQGKDYKDGMDETENLIKTCWFAFVEAGFSCKQTILTSVMEQKKWKRLSLKELFLEKIDLDLTQAGRKELCETCENLKINTLQTDTESDLFYRIFLLKIEPFLKEEGAIFLYDYPKYQAALSTLTSDDCFGQRFELYLNGIELCNGFTELTNPTEQYERFKKEAQERSSLGKTIFPIDEELLRLLPSIQSPTYGNALGIDRLNMILTGTSSIEDVLLFPMKKLFK